MTTLHTLLDFSTELSRRYPGGKVITISPSFACVSIGMVESVLLPGPTSGGDWKTRCRNILRQFDGVRRPKYVVGGKDKAAGMDSELRIEPDDNMVDPEPFDPA